METKIANRKREPGFVVITKDNKRGRTYHSKGEVNGKIPVYLEKEGEQFQYQEAAILCDPLTLTQKGFID